jgi:pheromone shutdown protein TraB
MRSAYGNFGTDPKALRTIMYQDNGRLLTQSLYSNGIKNSQGNPNSPNLAKINEFESKFSTAAQNPDVINLLGVIGTTKTKDLSKQQLQHLMSSKFGSMSPEQLQDLVDQRDQLIRLSQGK